MLFLNVWLVLPYSINKLARKKEYIEEQVIEKAMNLFWRNGYGNTSVQMLEKEMGINKFSIYSSFGSKNGVFLESIKCYKKRLSKITDKLKSSGNGLIGLKQYFYDFIDFSRDTSFGKGCLVSNTANELSDETDQQIRSEVVNFTSEIKTLFAETLEQDASKDPAIIKEQADYLIIAMFGLSAASRLFNKSELGNYIENIFSNL